MWHKNIRAQNFLILVFSLIGIVGSVHVLALKSEISLDERHQIETEVFTKLVNYISNYPDLNIDYIFLGISGSDPASEILDTFHNNIPTVEPITSSIITIGLSAPVVHKSDQNKRGIQIDLEIVDKEPSGYVKVLTSLYQHKLDSITYEYKLAKSDGIYRVISVKRP